MRWTRIFGSGAFRFSLLLALVFATGSLVLLITVERSIAAYALEATEGTLRSEVLVLAGEDRDGGRADLMKAIAHHRRAGGEEAFRYRVVDQAGHVLTNDLGDAPIRLGWGSVLVSDDPGNAASDSIETLRSLGTRLHDGSQLYVATDIYDVQELRRRLDWFTIWWGVGITLFALAGGYLVGRLFMQRLGRVNDAVGRVMAGNLTERLPTIGISAEFDLLSTNLNRMLDRIGALMEGLRQVSNDIAHDLRTPLTRLRQHLESTHGSQSIERYEAGIEMAIVQADEILGIFRTLLRIGSLEGGVGRQYFGVVDLSEVMDRVFEAHQPVAEDEGKMLIAEHAPGIEVTGDAEMLAQLFTNLIDNTLRHTPQGTRIVSRLVSDHGHPVASIADDGPGIPASERSNVLTRFYRLDASRHSSGSGLGLAMVASIASLHDAALELGDNHPGLIVTLRFPRQ